MIATFLAAAAIQAAPVPCAYRYICTSPPEVGDRWAQLIGCPTAACRAREERVLRRIYRRRGWQFPWREERAPLGQGGQS